MSESKASNDAMESWINDDFLETVLRRDEDDASLSVVNRKIERAVPVGDNYASQLVRVTIEYTIKDGTITKHRSLIVKTPPLGEFILEFIREAEVFERELRMYAVTLPEICKFVEDKLVVKYQIWPISLTSDRENAIILEDLRPLGYTMMNRREGLDFQHSLTAMKTLSKFHAASLALHESDPASIEFYTEVCYTKEHRHFHADFMEPAFRSLASEVETWPGFERFGDKIRKIADEAVDNVIDLVSKEAQLKVLNHGDIWTNNMLFRYNDEGNIADLKFLDFQLIRYASPALDIIYFLYTSPSQSVLEEFEEKLIAKYLDEFNNTLKSLGCQHLVVARDLLDKELKDKAFFAVVVSMMFCIMTAEPEDAPKFDAITNENKDEMANTVMSKAFAGKTFRDAFERRLVKFEEQGLI